MGLLAGADLATVASIRPSSLHQTSRQLGFGAFHMSIKKQEFYEGVARPAQHERSSAPQ